MQITNEQIGILNLYKSTNEVDWQLARTLENTLGDAVDYNTIFNIGKFSDFRITQYLYPKVRHELLTSVFRLSIDNYTTIEYVKYYIELLSILKPKIFNLTCHITNTELKTNILKLFQDTEFV